jgi:hypothetical protein
MSVRSLKVVILTKSSKYKNYCVAGINVDTGSWVRLVTNDKESHGALSYQNLLYSNGSLVDILDVVEVSIIKPKPSLIQPENVLIDTSTPLIKRGIIPLSDVLEIHPPEIHKTLLGNDSYYLSPAEINNINHSLTLIDASNCIFSRQTNSYGKTKIKMDFYYNRKYYSNISVTDPLYYQVQDQFRLRRALLVLSLPDDDWSRENGYYKFIAKIFTV